MVFLTLLIVPTLVALVSFLFFHRKITLQEFAIQMGAQIVVAGICAGIMLSVDTWDREVWNGVITAKKQVEVSCEHSYRCFCFTTCDSEGHCTETCQTCYEHSNDWDWRAYTSNGETFEIRRIDSRGSKEPPRWTAIEIGEPTSTAHSYTNYIKAAPDTLFRKQGLVEKYKGKLPAYPGNIYDYYRLDRTVALNFALPEVQKWNQGLSAINGALGRKKQANLILVLVQALEPDYFQALEQHWLGGKKNDVILVIGVDQALTIQWANVMAWTDHNILKVKLRDDIIEIGKLDREAILSAFAKNVDQHFIRKKMQDFKYLKSAITPSIGQWIFGLVFGLLVSIGLSVFFYREDIDGRR